MTRPLNPHLLRLGQPDLEDDENDDGAPSTWEVLAVLVLVIWFWLALWWLLS